MYMYTVLHNFLFKWYCMLQSTLIYDVITFALKAEAQGFACVQF